MVMSRNRMSSPRWTKMRKTPCSWQPKICFVVWPWIQIPIPLPTTRLPYVSTRCGRRAPNPLPSCRRCPHPLLPIIIIPCRPSCQRHCQGSRPDFVILSIIPSLHITCWNWTPIPTTATTMTASPYCHYIICPPRPITRRIVKMELWRAW